MAAHDVGRASKTPGTRRASLLRRRRFRRWISLQQLGGSRRGGDDGSVPDGRWVPGQLSFVGALFYSGDNTEFPDLRYLSQHGFLVIEPPSLRGTNPTQGMSTSRASAYRSADRTCRASAAAGVNSQIRTGAPLQDQWMNVVTAIDAGPQFQQALVGWQSCTRRAGLDVTTLSAFFDYADSQATHGGSAQDSVHLARIYATCLAPAEAVRDQLRQDDRVSFLTDNAGAIARLTSMLVPLEAQASQ